MGGDLVLLPSPWGARFCLTLSLDAVEALPAIAAVSVNPDLGGYLVLLVDDIATNRLVAATYPRLFGARVIEAESGEAALRLLDMNTPGLDGLQMLRD